jgi:hypothetical protein
MGVRATGGSGRRPNDRSLDYRAEVRGRSVDAGDVLRLALGGAARRVTSGGRRMADELRPELRLLARRAHPF